ncbi:MAG: hypothetical protein ACKOUM_07930, partial [Sphingopyxis sp.]
MVFEAYWSRRRLAGLAFIGLLFVAVGLWLFLRDDSFLAQTSGRSGRLLYALSDMTGVSVPTLARLCGLCAVALGVGVGWPIYKGLTAAGPAVRVDEAGITYARYSDVPMAWNNIASISAISAGNQDMLRIKLINWPTPPGGVFSFLFNRSSVVISLQGTDGKF